MSQNPLMLTVSNGSAVFIVGITAFSERSQEEITLVINSVKPNSVVIESCPTKKLLLAMGDIGLRNIASPNRVSEGLINSIRQVGFFPAICEQIMLKFFYGDTEMLQGAEYHRAAIEAKKYCNHVCLGDRPLGITISRLMSMLGWVKTIKFMFRICSLLRNCVNEEGLLVLNENDPIVRNLIADVVINYSEVGKVLFEERDKCFTYILQKHAGIQIDHAGVHIKDVSTIVVAVVGSYHIHGILKYWGTVTKEEYEQLSVIQPESRTTITIRFVCKVSVCSVLLWGIIKTSKALKQILN